MGKEVEEVSVQKVSIVVPESRAQRRVMFLTSCDLVCRSYPYINRVFFYKQQGICEYAEMARGLQQGLAKTLVSFYPLAGRFSLDDDARLQVDCCDAGAEFVEASCPLPFSLLCLDGFQYRPLFWHLARRTHYLRSDYLHEPILSVQVTKFPDGGFTVGVSMSHAVADAQSFYDFMRCWSDTCKGVAMTVPPVHMRMALTVKALLPLQQDSPLQNFSCCTTKKKDDTQEEKIPLDARDPKLEEELLSHLMASKELQNGNKLAVDELVKELQQMGLVGDNPDGHNVKAPSRARAAPIMEKQMEEEEKRRPVSDLVQKVFSFSTEMLQRLKEKANAGTVAYPEPFCKGLEDVIAGSPGLSKKLGNGVGSLGLEIPNYGFTTFEAFCAHWWQSLIRARCLAPAQRVCLLIPINCRQRFLDIPKGYFGNALDGGLVKLTAGQLCGAEIQEIAGKIHEAIKAATEESFRQYIKEAEKKRNAIPHFDRTGLFHVVDSPKYPVYEIDFGLGKPEAVRAEGFRFGAEVQVLAGRLGAGSYDLFCALDSDTMHRLEDDPAFLAC